MAPFGSAALLVSPDSPSAPSITYRRLYDTAATATWETPESWTVTAVALVGSGNRSPDADLAAQPRDADHRVSPAGVEWTLPKYNLARLSVVERQEDGWYLVDDALGARHDIVFSTHPIVEYSIHPGQHDIMLAIDGPDGLTNWWLRGQDLTEIDLRADSFVWHGNHPAWASTE
ncbi:MAG: hypothetical protein P8N02_07785 [Actinomycetota bacterium]|jgi:hypothetical protein|nr:hypothetical protein [Actinomycetota bacterium]